MAWTDIAGRASCLWTRNWLRREEREAYLQQVNDLWRTLPRPGRQVRRGRIGAALPGRAAKKTCCTSLKNAPLLEPWQREIARIVRKVAQYFYPAAANPGHE